MRMRFLTFIFVIQCGVKTTPTPIYPGFPGRMEEEAGRRAEVEKSETKKTEKENKISDETFIENYYGKPSSPAPKEKTKKSIKGKNP